MLKSDLELVRTLSDNVTILLGFRNLDICLFWQRIFAFNVVGTATETPGASCNVGITTT